MGWELDLGSITRTPQNGQINFIDGNSFEVRFAGSSEAVTCATVPLPQSELARFSVSLPGDVSATSCHAKIETSHNRYLHLKRRNADGRDEEVGWIVIDKSGLRYEFGFSTEAREERILELPVELPPGPRPVPLPGELEPPELVKEEDPEIISNQVLRWLLERVRDPNGNSLEIRYGQDRVLDTVTYVDQGITVHFETVGGVNANKRYFPIYRQGFLDRDQLGSLLRAIEIRDEGIRLMRFEFTYEAATRSRSDQLKSIVQYGRSNATAMPMAEFEYYEGGGLQLSENAQTERAERGSNDGYVGTRLQLIDLNGDSLPDQIYAFENSWDFEVHFNTGSGFEAQGHTWSNPLQQSGCRPEYCRGKLQGSTGSDYLYLFLMDMNGDGLPDRVVRLVDGGAQARAIWKIAFHNGSGWDQNLVEWRDPYEGRWAGNIGGYLGFIDMNGDGLVDRVAGDRASGHFRVYYGTGNGFEEEPALWVDPVAVSDPNHSARAKIQGGDNLNTHTFIRDMNGDGLPDRVWKVDIVLPNVQTQVGFAVALNKNGKAWAIPEIVVQAQNRRRILYNGVDVLAIMDPVDRLDSRGQLDRVADWMDFNNDGYLDRVYGDRGGRKFRVWFFQGMAWGENGITLSAPVEFDDPLPDTGGDGPGWIRSNWDDKLTSFFQDMNGDGYPDRVGNSSRDSRTPTNNFLIYALRSDPTDLRFSNYPAQILHTINQPTQYLKRISSKLQNIQDAYLQDNFIQYLPSSFRVMGARQHRFLPYSLYLPRHLYALDPTYLSGTVTQSQIPYENYRSTTYTFYGGNHYVRKFRENNSGDTSDDERPVAQFNGFQQVEKEVKARIPVKTRSYYHQAAGDVTIPWTLSPLDNAGYTHFSLSGRSYKQEVREADFLLVSETSAWVINAPLNSDNYYCTGICAPELRTQRKEAWEPTAPGGPNSTNPSRVSQQEFHYDTQGNIRLKIDQDAQGAEILTQESIYDVSSRLQDAHIQDRPRFQCQKKLGQLYRQKYFEYDDAGNPILERYYYKDNAQAPAGSESCDVAGPLYVQIMRDFYPNGTLRRITDMDGITKEFAYNGQPHDVFPTTETVLHSAGNLVKIRRFNRLNGEQTFERANNGVVMEKIFDDFGRPLEEWLVSRGSQRQLLKSLSYDYQKTTVNRWQNLVVLKTSVFEPQPGHPDTLTNPSGIMYAVHPGETFQQCSYSERGNYREIHTRTEDDGRIEKQTEPRFVSACLFSASIPTSSRLVTTTKDFFGRGLRKTLPSGDNNSPVTNGTSTYAVQNGRLKKITFTQRGIQTLSKEEYFDGQERLVEMHDPEGNIWNYEYNPVGDLRFVRHGAITLTEIQYDTLGRKRKMIDADMGTWEYHYNDAGQMDWQKDAKLQLVEMDYDDLGRVREKRYRNTNGTLSRRETTIYDSGDRSHNVILGELFQIQEKDAANTILRTTRYGYDDEYRRTTLISRDIPGVATFTQSLGHDFRGRVTGTIYPGGTPLFYRYDRVGGLTKVCGAVSCDTTIAPIYYSIDPLQDYDVYGSLLKEHFGNNVETDYQYYPNSHRLREKRTYHGTQNFSRRSYTYDEHDNLKNIGDLLNTTNPSSGGIGSVTYDANDRINTYTPSSNPTLVDLDYDARGNLLQNPAAYPNLRYEYTDPDHVHAVKQIGNNTFDYDANGNMTRDPHRDRMVYDARNKLTRVEMKNHAVVEYDYDYADSRVMKKVTRTDPLGVVTTATTHYLGDSIEVRGDKILLHIYAGDRKIATRAVGTLSQITGGAGSTLRHTGISPPFNLTIAAPFVMFLLTMFVVASLRPIRHPGIFVQQKYPGSIIDPLSITQRAITMPEAGAARIAPTIIHAWNTYAHICLQTLQGFSRSVVRARHAVPLHCHLVSLFLIFTMLANPFAVWAGDTADPQAGQNDEAYFFYYHGDHLGSSNVLTEGKDSSVHSGITYRKGDLLQRFEYDVFGKEKYVLNPNLSFEPSYTGQIYDMETGLYYYKARYYNPLLGRFIQPDTIVPDGKDLQAYNRYTYVMNNPLKYTDPSGHSWSLFKKLLGAFIGALISVLSFGALAAIAGVAIGALSFAQVVAFGALSGLVGGVVGGAITGGVRGALMGAALGFVGGALFGAANFGLSAAVGQGWAFGIMSGVGASLSYATGGWKGLLTFGVGILGAMAGKGLLGAVKGGDKYQLPYKNKNRFNFEYDSDEPYATVADAGNSNPNVATDANPSTLDGVRGPTGVGDGKGYLDVNFSRPGFTGGFIIDSAGRSYIYGGFAIASQGIAATASPNSVSTGWNFGFQAGYGAGGQIGYGGGSLFLEVGAVSPGISLSGYYIWRIPSRTTNWQ